MLFTKPAAADEVPLAYASYSQRLSAHLIDFFLVMMPVGLLGVMVGELSRNYFIGSLVFELLFGVYFQVYLVFRYGATPGKQVMGIRIAMKDGSPVTLKAVILRHSVGFLLSVLGAAGFLNAVLDLSNGEYGSIPYLTRHKLIESRFPLWLAWAFPAAGLWFWSELFTMLLSEDRRAFQDFLAGTVVLRDKA